MDIFFIMMLFTVALIFTVFAWLPNFGTLNQIIYSVFAMGIWFIIALLMSDATMTVLQPYPANSTVVNVGGNLTITNQDATFTTHTFTDSFLINSLFIALGLVMMYRFVAIVFVFLKELSVERKIL